MQRRSFLQKSIATAALLRMQGVGAEEPTHVMHNHMPVNCETLPRYLEPFLTPTRAFYARSHHPNEPKLSGASWKLRVDGLVAEPLELGWDELQTYNRKELVALLQCSGNGRAHYRPRVPGAAWDIGALGNAAWTGVTLGDLLSKAKAQARFVIFNGADHPLPGTTTPKFSSVLPIEKARDEDTLLAFEMNGRPLSHLHGFPVRVVVPGWQGHKWAKWLTRITLVEEVPGDYWYVHAYRLPTRKLAPHEKEPAREMRPIEGMPVKSILHLPGGGRVSRGRKVLVRGKAWTGDKLTVTGVEVDAGEGWSPARLTQTAQPYTWVPFEFEWTPRQAGPVKIRSRAQDSGGNRQPESNDWNPSGYNWNAVHEATVEVL